MTPIPEDALVVPSGKEFNHLQALRRVLAECTVVAAGTDAPGFFFSEAGDKLTLKLPIPAGVDKLAGLNIGTITLGHCDPVGTTTFLTAE